MTTKQLAERHGISTADRADTAGLGSEQLGRDCRQVAARAIVLHSLSAIGFGVDSAQIREWLAEEKLTKYATPRELEFLSPSFQVDDTVASQLIWRKEACWTLLWALGFTEALGLPTHQCDTKKLVDEIMPALGGSTHEFLSDASFRDLLEISAEDLRHYDLLCFARQAAHQAESLTDLIFPVLWERCYAFNWLNGDAEWDKITVDS